MFFKGKNKEPKRVQTQANQGRPARAWARGHARGAFGFTAREYLDYCTVRAWDHYRTVRSSYLHQGPFIKRKELAAVVRYRALVSGYCARHGKARCTTNATVSGSEWHSFSRRAA